MKNVIKFFVILIIGEVCFEMICAGTQYIILSYFDVETNFYGIMLENFPKNIIIYFSLCCCLFILNFIYNYLIVKNLNRKLKILKRERGEEDGEK